MTLQKDKNLAFFFFFVSSLLISATIEGAQNMSEFCRGKTAVGWVGYQQKSLYQYQRTNQYRTKAVAATKQRAKALLN